MTLEQGLEMPLATGARHSFFYQVDVTASDAPGSGDGAGNKHRKKVPAFMSFQSRGR